jgi:hypothetical protein
MVFWRLPGSYYTGTLARSPEAGPARISLKNEIDINYAAEKSQDRPGNARSRVTCPQGLKDVWILIQKAKGDTLTLIELAQTVGKSIAPGFRNEWPMIFPKSCAYGRVVCRRF